MSVVVAVEEDHRYSFQQSRSQMTMDLDERPNHILSQHVTELPTARNSLPSRISPSNESLPRRQTARPAHRTIAVSIFHAPVIGADVPKVAH